MQRTIASSSTTTAAVAAPRRARGAALRERGFLVAALVPPFFFLICFYVYPTVFNIENSLTDLSLFGMRQGGEWVGVDNYAELLTSPDFRRVLWNTVVWLTIVGVSVRIVLGLALAFLLNSATLRRWRLQTISRILLIVPWATPPVVAIVVWRWLLDPRVGTINQALMAIGLVDQPIAFLATAAWVWPAVITIITWNTLPLVTLTFLASLQSLPHELVEAAEIVMATEICIKAFVEGRLGFSSATGVVMATIMTVFGLIYLRVIAERELKEEGEE